MSGVLVLVLLLSELVAFCCQMLTETNNTPVGLQTQPCINARVERELGPG